MRNFKVTELANYILWDLSLRAETVYCNIVNPCQIAQELAVLIDSASSSIIDIVGLGRFLFCLG